VGGRCGGVAIVDADRGSAGFDSPVTKKAAIRIISAMNSTSRGLPGSQPKTSAVSGAAAR
jgi:hypothetical protein